MINKTTLSQLMKSNVIKNIVLTLFFITILFYCIIYGISPRKTIKEYNNIALSDSLYMQKEGLLYNYYELYDISRIKAFKEALYKQTIEDSIGLIINLRDSLVSLVIKGVKIHTAKISYYKVDKTLRCIMNASYVKIFSFPLEVKSEKATIVKEPIIVKKAPKDTAEAAKLIYTPDTLKTKPSFFKYTLEPSIELFIGQNSNTSIGDKIVKLKFNSVNLSSSFVTNLFKMLAFKEIKYKPYIKVKIPSDDVSIIYRALPVYPKIVILF